MNGKHEPRGEFVAALEARLDADARLRQSARLPRWMPKSTPAFALAASILIMVSMAAGGAMVAFAYQAQTTEARDLLLGAYRQRLNLARLRLDSAQKQLADGQQRLSVGAATNIDVLDLRQKVADAEVEVQTVQIQIEEIQSTGREPVDSVSAAVVAGKDFVMERWRLQLTTGKGALDLAQRKLSDIQARVSIGAADSFDVDRLRSAVSELEATLAGLQRKLAIRQKFVAKAVDGPLADLQVLESDADQRVTILRVKIDLAQKEYARTSARAQVGAAQALDVSEAQLRRTQLEYELAKAQYDLAYIKQQIAQRK